MFLALNSYEVKKKTVDKLIMITISKAKMLTFKLCDVPETTAEVFMQMRK